MLSLIAGCRKDLNSDIETPEFVFVPEFVSLPDEIVGVQNLVCAGDKLYFSVETTLDEEASLYTTKLFSIGLDGSDLTELTCYVSPGSSFVDAQGHTSITALRIDNNSDIWVVETGRYYRVNIPENFDGENGDDLQFYEDIGAINLIRKLDSTGAELISIDINTLFEKRNLDFFYVTTFNIDDAGNAYIGIMAGDDSRILVIDRDGRLQFELEVSHGVNNLIRMPDGSIAFFLSSTTGMALRIIDYSRRAWGNSLELPDFVNSIFPGGEDFNFIYCNSASLYGFNIESNESARILNWIDSYIMFDDLYNITILPDGRILCISEKWSTTRQENIIELIFLTKARYTDLPKREILTLASVWLDDSLRSAVVQFNRTNPKYRVDLVDYTGFNTEENLQAGLVKLSADIISGKVPDMLDVYGLPYKQYAAKNLLEDLYQFIDSDPVYNRNDFVESVFRAFEVDSALYQVFPCFYIETVIGHPFVVGEGMGWNMNEFSTVIDAYPGADVPAGQWLTKNSFFKSAVTLRLDEYVDWTAGKANFDTGEFIQLLELANTFPKEIDNDGIIYLSNLTRITEGRQIMVNMGFYNFDDYKTYCATFGGAVVFKGFPTESRSGNILHLNSGIAITTKCANKDGAWEFVRTFLDKDWQLENSMTLPTNKAALEQKLVSAMSEPDYISLIGSDETIALEIKAMTREDVDQIHALIESSVSIASGNDALINIIMEGAEDYFNDLISAQDAAKVIQNRADIYISEQR